MTPEQFLMEKEQDGGTESKVETASHCMYVVGLVYWDKHKEMKERK